MQTMTPTVKAPTGTTLQCRGWHQEAALRMLMNNLDPDVAENPAELIVYGGGGKAARNWACYHKIVETLKRLKNDETLLVQSGKPEGVIEKMVEGRLKKFFAENCLLEQAFVKDPDRSVGDVAKAVAAEVGANATVSDFARFRLGEESTG